MRALVKKLLGRGEPVVRVHVLIKGRIGEGWQDVDRTLELGRVPWDTANAALYDSVVTRA